MLRTPEFFIYSSGGKISIWVHIELSRNKSGGIKDELGELVAEHESIKKRWKLYVEVL